MLEPEEHVIFFVADSHRPTDVCNVYSSSQVCTFATLQFSFLQISLILSHISQIRVLCKATPEEEVPNFEDIFKDDDDEDDDENEVSMRPGGESHLYISHNAYLFISA